MKIIIFVSLLLLSELSFAQTFSQNGYGYIRLDGSFKDSKDLMMFSIPDSLSSEQPVKTVTIHSDFNNLPDKKKAEQLAIIEKWVMSQRKKLK